MNSMLSTTSRFLTFASMRIYWNANRIRSDQTKVENCMQQMNWHKNENMRMILVPLHVLQLHIHFNAFAFKEIALKHERASERNGSARKITHFCPNLEWTTRVTETLIIITISSETAILIAVSFPFSCFLVLFFIHSVRRVFDEIFLTWIGTASNQSKFEMRTY